MTSSTKEAIIKALKADLGNAGDNLYRAKSRFRNGTPADMQSEYGESGRTCQQILDGYQEWHDAASAAIKEAEETL